MKSINQVRHPYVALNYNATPTVKGDIAVVKGDGAMKFKYMSPGGLVTSDYINTDNILYVTHTKAEKLKYTLKNVTISIDAESVIKGQEYVVKVLFTNYAGGGDDNITVKYGMAVAEKTGDAAALAKLLEASLKKNLKDLVPLALVSSDDDSTIAITEVEQPWEAGVKPFCVMPFEVELFPIVKDGVEDSKWATITKGNGAQLANGKKIADLEWFHTGARGDMYRGFGHPYGVRTELLADPTKNYDTLDIHYSYVGPNEGVQKSEKTITIIAESTVMTKILADGVLPTEVKAMLKVVENPQG